MGLMGSKSRAQLSYEILCMHWSSNFGIKMSLTMMAVSMLMSPSVGVTGSLYKGQEPQAIVKGRSLKGRSLKL